MSYPPQKHGPVAVGDRIRESTGSAREGVVIDDTYTGTSESWVRTAINNGFLVVLRDNGRPFYVCSAHIDMIERAKPQHEPLFVGDSGWRA